MAVKKLILSEVIYILIIIATTLVMLILIIPVFIVKIFTIEDISGWIIRPYKNIMTRIALKYLNDNDFKFITGFPKKTYQNESKTKT